MTRTMIAVLGLTLLSATSAAAQSRTDVAAEQRRQNEKIRDTNLNAAKTYGEVNQGGARVARDIATVATGTAAGAMFGGATGAIAGATAAAIQVYQDRASDRAQDRK